MITSDEERREVAARLRATKSECESRDYPWVVEDLLQALGFERYEDAEDGIFERLADLIDRPTCRLDLTDVETHGNVKVRIYECSRCGRTCEDVYGKYERCPHCGGVVVEDD